MAYLLNPIMKWFERFYIKEADKIKRTDTQTVSENPGSVGSFCHGDLLAIIVVLIWLIIPRLVVCIEDIVTSMGEKVQNLTKWVDRLTKQNSAISGKLDTFIADASVYLEDWLRKMCCSSLILLQVSQPVFITS